VRSLSTEEKQLWERVAATIRPLSREPLKLSAPASQHNPANATAAPLPLAPRPLPPRTASPVRTLDSTWDRRLRSGDVQPDRVIDLHEMTLDRAWSAIDVGLERAVASGERIVLLITGHARSGAPPIRAGVHVGVEASRHASRFAGVGGAHGRHGGGGSLYIILRRDRSKSTLS
jgi:DNA-nicking Smr family endonuclease